MKTRCLIVDDEPLALELLETYLSKLNDVEIIGQCTNAVRAFEILQAKQIDLLFLDIQMPQLDGISLLKTLQNPPQVIFTTAYREYALDGYDLNVIDYLLKPISFDRFMKAMDKYYRWRESAQRGVHDTGAPTYPQERFLYVRSDKKNMKVYLKDIYYLESMEDYVCIRKRDSQIITKDLLSRFEEILPPEMFLRIHRSIIVSIPKIDAITSTTIEIGKKELPIGRSYKKAVEKTLQCDSNK